MADKCKKKVALITCYFQPNYGSMLQAYATQYILDKWGVENETICIEGLKREIQKKKVKYFKSRIFSMDVLSDKFGFAILKAATLLDIDGLKKKRKLREERLLDFSTKNFRMSPQYNSIEELTEHAEEYAAFLVGSDQLWLPSNIAAEYYTLSYIPDDILKISYATSFGVTQLPKKQIAQAGAFLPRIKYLSVREESGKKLVYDSFGLEAEVVCDPTLLLEAEDWSKLENTSIGDNRDYILCYFLGNNVFSRECVKKLKNHTGKKLIGITQLDQYIKLDNTLYDDAPFDVDPADFLGLIRNASYVCTDSFHCTVFSMMYHKPFFTFKRFEKSTSMSTNSRIDTLIDMVDLRDRLIEEAQGFEAAIERTIDYRTVDEKIKKFRTKSELFLREALKTELILQC